MSKKFTYEVPTFKGYVLDSILILFKHFSVIPTSPSARKFKYSIGGKFDATLVVAYT